MKLEIGKLDKQFQLSIYIYLYTYVISAKLNMPVTQNQASNILNYRAYWAMSSLSIKLYEDAVGQFLKKKQQVGC